MKRLSAPMTREELENRVVTLVRRGSSRRAISRALGISRNTVKDILDAHDLDREEQTSALPDKPAVSTHGRCQ